MSTFNISKLVNTLCEAHHRPIPILDLYNTDKGYVYMGKSVCVIDHSHHSIIGKTGIYMT